MTTFAPPSPLTPRAAELRDRQALTEMAAKSTPFRMLRSIEQQAQRERIARQRLMNRKPEYVR